MNELTTPQNAPAPQRQGAENIDWGVSPLMNPARFDHMYRIGRMLASSALWPAHLKGRNPEEGAANGMLCLNMAERLREDPLTVAQNIYFVSGKPGWNTTYMIAKANMHGVFSDPIDWDVKGSGDTLSVTAFGLMAKSGNRVQVTCDMKMAKAEGWTSNKKYQSMPEQMLRYRSAAFLIRLYAPEVMIGVPAQVELELDRDYRDVTPQETAPQASIMEAVTGSVEGSAARIAAPEAEKVDRTPPAPAVTEKTVADAKAKAEAEAAAKEKAEKAEAAAKEKAEKAEAKAKAEQEAKAKAEAEAKAKAKAEADAAAAQAQETPHDPETGEVLDQAPAAGEAYERLAATAKAIMRDLEGNSDPDSVLQFYEEQIDKIKAQAPELHAEIMEAAAP